MLNDEPQVGAVHAAVAARLAPADARRSEYLDWLVKKGGTCRGCGATVVDAGLVEHPGVCGSCYRRKHLAPLEPPVPAKAPEPKVEEETMPNGSRKPCPECGSPSRHKASCSKPGRNGTVVSPAKRPSVRALRGFRGRDLAGMSVDDLVGTIAGCREELGRRKEELAGQQAAIEQALGSG